MAKAPTIAKTIALYYKSREYLDLKWKTQLDYESHLTKICATKIGRKVLANYTLDEIKASHLNQAYNIWLESGIRTANYRKAVLGAVWKYAMRNDMTDRNPLMGIRTKSTKPRKVKWEREHIKAFFDVAYSDFRYRSIGLIVHMAYSWNPKSSFCLRSISHRPSAIGR